MVGSMSVRIRQKGSIPIIDSYRAASGFTAPLGRLALLKLIIIGEIK